MDRFVILYLCPLRRCFPSSLEMQPLWFLTVCVCTLFHFFSFLSKIFLGMLSLRCFAYFPRPGRLHLLPVFDRSYFNHGSLALQLQSSQKKAGGEKKTVSHL